MKKLRSLLPILILIAIGVGLFFSGALNRFSPDNLAHEQAALQAQIAQHPIIAALIHIAVVTLSISTARVSSSAATSATRNSPAGRPRRRSSATPPGPRAPTTGARSKACRC